VRDTRAPTFELRVVAEGEQGYRLALWQRAAGSCAPTRLSEEQEGTSAVSPLRGAERGTGGEVGSRPLVTLAGSALQVALDQVLDALKREGHRATALRPTRGEPLVLGDEAGVRLGLLFLALKPLTKVSRMEAIAAGLRGMPAEEAYYWFSKCAARQHSGRAQQALRILLAGE